MGTNYYFKFKDELVSRHQAFFIKKLAAIEEEAKSLLPTELVQETIDEMNEGVRKALFSEIHIGKFSGGHPFTFAADNFKEQADIVNKFNTGLYKIVDEYEKEHALEDLCTDIVKTEGREFIFDRPKTPCGRYYLEAGEFC